MLYLFGKFCIFNNKIIIWFEFLLENIFLSLRKLFFVTSNWYYRTLYIPPLLCLQLLLFLPYSCIQKAGQSCEVETLIPLIHRCNKLVLVGDPRQLPPTVKSIVSVLTVFFYTIWWV